jgi:ABC-2 type transport system permease protein
MSALTGLLRKETYHIVRDRRTLIVLIALPIVQVVLFGFAIRNDVDRVRLAIVDPSPDSNTLALRGRFAATDLFTTVAVLPRTDTVDALFRTGRAQVAVVFPDAFAEDVQRGDAQVQVVVDATEPNTASLVQNYAIAVIQSYDHESGGAAVHVAITPRVRTRFNPTRESVNLFVPGLMAFVLTIISSLMTAITLSREKETGTLETLLVSPLQPVEIIIGKVAPYLVIGVIAVIAVIAEARFVFGVPIRGNVALLLGEGLLFILVSLSLGILVSARTSSQRVAMMGAMVGTMLPTMLLSGFIFPVESMPAPLRILSYVVPGRWFVTIARGVMLKGIGLEYLWRETLVLAAMAAVLLVASVRSFKERLG